MSLIKLANKLTKVFNTLSTQGQKLAAPALRPMSQFVSGIERGNNNLIGELQRTKPQVNFKFNDIHNPLGSNYNIYTHQFNVQTNPTSLTGAIAKRHEIWEAQQALGTKKLGKQLKPMQKSQNEWEAKHNFHKTEKNLLAKRIDSLNDHPGSEKASNYLTNKYNKHNDILKNFPDNPAEAGFFGHHNPQVIMNENKLMAQTPGATRTGLYRFRMQNEAPALKANFNFKYGV